MQQARSARILDVSLTQTEPRMSEAITRAISGDLTLDVSQAQMVNAFGIGIFWAVEDSFLQHKAGLLDETSWEIERTVLTTYLSFPCFRVSWRLNRMFSSGEYRSYVDTLLHTTKPSKPLDIHGTWKTLMVQELAKAA
jgi:hypothetical protein